jgi:hypothetical protein
MPSSQPDIWLLAAKQPTTLSELFGPASIFSLSVGLTCAALSYCCYRWMKAWLEYVNVLKIFYYLPLIMGAIGVAQTLMVAQSYAYSGPVVHANVYREPGRFELRFAAQIAFTFGLVFAFDALRIQVLRKNLSTWATILLYGVVVIHWLTSYR